MKREQCRSTREGAGLVPGRKWEHKHGSPNIPDLHYSAQGKWVCYGCGDELRQKS